MRFGIIIIGALTCSSLLGCHGPMGPMGPIGAIGPQGLPGPSTLSAAYLGECSVSPGQTCKCNKGERIMLLEGNAAGSAGFCTVHNQNSDSVKGVCDPVSQGPSHFVCFK
jgi:hypothetical protein